MLLPWGGGGEAASDLGEQIQHRGSPPNLDGLTEGQSPCSRTHNYREDCKSRIFAIAGLSR